MIELRTLGPLDLIAPGRPDAQGLLHQPKRCAVLAYLAVAAPHGFVRRDTLLALFWPEADQARGRNALRQTVYQLRQFLGADAIRSRGDEEISAAPEVVVCDAPRFEQLLAEGKTAQALELYRGDFLTGFHVPDAAAELEEWMQSEARRLRALATTAAWSLALAEEQRGNAGGAAHWARRVTALDPLHEQRLSDVMQLLARLGDRAGALHVYQEYVRRARAELGVAPPAGVEKLAADLRRAPPPVHDDVAVEPIVVNNVAPPATAVSPAAEGATAAASPRPMRVPVRSLLWAVPALAVLALGTLLWQRTRAARLEPIIAVGHITGAAVEPAGPPLHLAADLLSTSLARLQGVQVIPLARVTDVQAQLIAARRPATSMIAAARQLGATYLIEGTTRPAADGGLQLELQLLNVRTGAVERVERAGGSDLFGAVDRATSAIALAFDVRTPAEPIAQVTTTSLAAYRLYEQGLHAYYQEGNVPAHRLFRAALAEDSSFAMAAYYAGLTATPPEQHQLLRRALTLANRTTDRERLLIAHGVAQLGMSATATALADTIAVRYPLDPDAQFAFGDVLLRRGEFLAAARQYRRVITMDSLSLHGTARCLACDAYGQLAWAYLYADSADAAVRVLHEVARARPGLRAFATLEMALARAGRFDEARTMLHAADSVAPGNVDLEFRAATLALREGDFAAADARLERLLHASSAQVRGSAAWYLMISLRTQGRFREALRLAERHPEPLARAVVLADMGEASSAAAAFQSLVGFTDTNALPGHRAKHRAWLMTHVATSLAAAGDTSSLLALADSVDRNGRLSAFGRDLRLHHYIRGLLWNARQQPARAAESFRQSIWSWSEGYTRANYELARTLMAQQRPEEALYPLQSALRGDVEASNLYISRTELHELLAQAFDQLGRRDSAAVHYRYVADAWQHADARLQPRFATARTRLQQLSADTPQTP